VDGDAQSALPACDGDWILPDPTGFVASASNLSGITGAWSLHRDCDDLALIDGGAPVPGQSCALVTSPVAGSPFVPQPDSFDMCTSGSTVHVLADSELATEWGAYITLPLNAPSGAEGTYDATALRGFCVFLSGDVVPTVRLRFPTDQGIADGDWYQATVQHEGWHQVLFQDLLQIQASGPPFDPSKLLAIEVEIPSSRAEAIPWDFCVDAVVALR
jgi:hypothetical protein